MSKHAKSHDEDQKKPERSSHGDNSASVTPKDVSHRHASSKDVTERKTTSTDPDEKEDAMLDDSVDMTFPASDPPAVGSITRVEKGKEQGARKH